MNKKYKERKKEINDLINFLEKKNLNLAEKIKRLECNMKDFDENKMFFDKNDNDNDNEDNEENEELSHEVEIEYEDGIDKNAEINYEDDAGDNNDYDIEKENELMNQGINPYNKQSVLKNADKKIKQIIVKDNDESEDKC